MTKQILKKALPLNIILTSKPKTNCTRSKRKAISKLNFQRRSVDDQADIEESPSFEYDSDFKPKNEPSKLEMDKDMEIKLPKEIREMVEIHERRAKIIISFCFVLL